MRPQAGDVLAFKTLSLNEEKWTPELSAYREATVSLDGRKVLARAFDVWCLRGNRGPRLWLIAIRIRVYSVMCVILLVKY